MLGTAAWADERIVVCYNYGCLMEEPVRFSEVRLGTIKKQLLAAKSAEEERQVLSLVIGQMYRWAGQQTPIYADRGGNMADNGARGSMDCIDHSTTTTRFLRMIESRGWLHYHHVLPVVRRVRFFIFQHFSAAIEESGRWMPKMQIDEHPEAPDEATPDRFVVDSWFVDNGKPAVVMPLDDWMSGGGPEVEPN